MHLYAVIISEISLRGDSILGIEGLKTTFKILRNGTVMLFGAAGRCGINLLGMNLMMKAQQSVQLKLHSIQLRGVSLTYQ